MDALLEANYHLSKLFEQFGDQRAGQLLLDRYEVLFLHLVFNSEFPKAIQLAETVLSVAQKMQSIQVFVVMKFVYLKDKKLTIQATRSLGEITLQSKMKIETATKYIAHSLKMAIDADDKIEIVKCLTSQGYLVYLMEDLEQAKRILHDALLLTKGLSTINEEGLQENLLEFSY